MSEEIIIINDEPFYRIPNGTSYDYAPIPKEFKTYFERLKQENTQLKSVLKEIREYIKDKQKIQYKFALSHIECDDILEIIDKGIGGE